MKRILVFRTLYWFGAAGKNWYRRHDKEWSSLRRSSLYYYQCIMTIALKEGSIISYYVPQVGHYTVTCGTTTLCMGRNRIVLDIIANCKYWIILRSL